MSQAILLSDWKGLVSCPWLFHDWLEMEDSFVVEESLTDLLDRASNVAELLSRADLSPEVHGAALTANTREFGELVKKVHSLLDERILKTLDDEIPLQHNSYLQREELENAVLRAKYLIAQIKQK
jgi:hypothetical protein